MGIGAKDQSNHQVAGSFRSLSKVGFCSIKDVLNKCDFRFLKTLFILFLVVSEDHIVTETGR